MVVLITATEGRWAIVGGFAVWVHLGGAHRVTLDVDTAAGPIAHQNLVTVGTPGTNSGNRNLAGTELEVIEVDSPTGELDGLNPKQRLFVTAHWAAAAHPIQATIHCSDATVVAPIADWLALLGCKLHAWLDRPSSQDTRRGSDGLDIIQRLRQQPTPVTRPPIDGLPEDVRWAAQHVLLDQPTLVRRLILIHTETSIDVREITLLGRELLELLE